MGRPATPVPIRFWSKVDKNGPLTQYGRCWLWTDKIRRDGYGVLRIAGHNIRAHRIAWELEHGKPPDDLWVLHRCDTPLCVRHGHLFLGTPLDNALDRAAKGRSATGDRHWTHLYPELIYRAGPTNPARGTNHGRHTKPDRSARGERIGRAKLTENAIQEIRKLTADGITRRALSERFGVSTVQIGNIVRGRSWAHVSFSETYKIVKIPTSNSPLGGKVRR